MKASEIMNLVDEAVRDYADFYISKGGATKGKWQVYLRDKAKLQAFADEYSDLKHCYSPDKVFKITGKIE